MITIYTQKIAKCDPSICPTCDHQSYCPRYLEYLKNSKTLTYKPMSTNNANIASQESNMQNETLNQTITDFANLIEILSNIPTDLENLNSKLDEVNNSVNQKSETDNNLADSINSLTKNISNAETTLENIYKNIKVLEIKFNENQTLFKTENEMVNKKLDIILEIFRRYDSKVDEEVARVTDTPKVNQENIGNIENSTAVAIYTPENIPPVEKTIVTTKGFLGFGKKTKVVEE